VDLAEQQHLLPSPQRRQGFLLGPCRLKGRGAELGQGRRRRGRGRREGERRGGEQQQRKSLGLEKAGGMDHTVLAGERLGINGLTSADSWP
jgi:hypothetical protein